MYYFIESLSIIYTTILCEPSYDSSKGLNIIEFPLSYMKLGIFLSAK